MRRNKALLFGMAAGALLAVAIPVQAQVQPTPPEHYTLDPRGVDLVTGRFAHQATEVVIGQPGAGGITHARVWANDGWRDTLSGTIAVSGSTYVVSLGPISEVFTKSGSTFTAASNNGSTLVQTTAALLTFTTSDGTIATYSTAYNGSTTPYQANAAALMSVTQPNGEILSFYWDGYSYCRLWDLDPFTGEPGQCFDWANAVRLDGVGNNRGYLIDFLYAADDIPIGSFPQEWLRRTGAVGVNRAVDYCDPYDPCTLSRTWPSVTYDFGGTQVTDEMNRVTTYSYTGSLLSGIQLPGSTTADRTVTYGTDGKVSGVTDASGAWTYAYSDVGSTRTTTVTGPLSQSLVVVSDQTIGRATSVTNATSDTWSYQYAGGRLTRITNPEGNYTQYSYDARGNVIQEVTVPKSGSGLANITTTITYPTSCSGGYTAANCNKPLTVQDPRGNVTTYTWSSSHGGPLSITAPAVNGVNAQTRYAYAAFNAYYKNSVGSIVPAATAVTLPVEVSACATADDATGCDGTGDEVLATVAYGATSVPNNLLPTQVAQGSGATPNMAVTAMTYTPNGDVETVDGPLSGTDDTTRYRYDDGRQMVGVVGPDPDGGGTRLNRAQRMTYNSRGQVTLAEQGTTAGYSDTAWAAFVTLQKVAQDHDGYGRPIRIEMQAANGTIHGLAQTSYDAAGRVDCQVVRMNPAVFATVTANACVQGTNGTFGPDRITRATYDAVGRPTSTTSAYGITGQAITESVTFTDNGLPETLTDGEGNVSILVRDGFDRAKRLRYPNATGGGTSTTDYDEYGYDAASNVTSFRNRSAQLFETDYDPMNRAATIGGPAIDPRYLVYDNLSRVTRLYTNGGVVYDMSWTYDPLSRQLTQGDVSLGTLTSQYDPAGRRTRLTWPDGYYAAYDFDLYSGLTAVRENGATSGAGVLATYAYDDLGRPTAVTRGNGVSSSYGWDAISRLSSLSHDPSGTGQDVTIAFTQNPAGQIVGRTTSNPAYVFAPNTGSTAYTNDDLNRVTQVGSASVLYDTRGNVTSALGGIYGYDAENNLTSAGSATFAFDPLNRLRRVNGSTTTRFLYDGLQAVAEYPATGTTPTARHVPGVGLDDVVTSYAGSGTGSRTWLLADERQSVIGLADGSGAAGINAYDEYGVPSSGNAGRFQYTGQMWLPDAGLYHYRARTYNPIVGRFMQTDPLRYTTGANIYIYVSGDPMNWTDPTGLAQERDLINCWYNESGQLVCPVEDVTGRRCVFSSLICSIFGSFLYGSYFQDDRRDREGFELNVYGRGGFWLEGGRSCSARVRTGSTGVAQTLGIVGDSKNFTNQAIGLAVPDTPSGYALNVVGDVYGRGATGVEVTMIGANAIQNHTNGVPVPATVGAAGARGGVTLGAPLVGAAAGGVVGGPPGAVVGGLIGFAGGVGYGDKAEQAGAAAGMRFSGCR